MSAPGGRSPRPPWAPLLALSLAALLGAACDDPPAPMAPPRCEPRPELVVERQLKRGFKALAEGDRAGAAEVFRGLLAEEPGHPEAKLGLRFAARGAAAVRPRPRSLRSGELVIAGERVAVDLPIETAVYRFEERRRLWVLAKELGLAWAPEVVPEWFGPRVDAAGRPAPVDSREAVSEAIDLIVLGDSYTLTARERFARSGDSGASSHFIIDWDGVIYQTLDLALATRHREGASSERRAVAVDLVNPVVVGDASPLPLAAGERGVGRPLSHKVTVQGQERQAWGYTEPQLRSLDRLLRVLLRLLPRVPALVPRVADGSGAIPRAVVTDPHTLRGVAGYLHLSADASDPGPGFDWERLAGALGR